MSLDLRRPIVAITTSVAIGLGLFHAVARAQTPAEPGDDRAPAVESNQPAPLMLEGTTWAPPAAQKGPPPSGAAFSPPGVAPAAAGKTSSIASGRAPAAPTLTQRFQIRGGVDFGWNSLTGLGGTLSATFLPHVEADAGVGVSALGWRAGARLRLTPLRGAFRPFLGAGLSLSAGTLGRTVRLDSDDNAFEYKVKLAPFAQVVGGIETLDDSGWVLMLTGGYAYALRASNIEITSGMPLESQQRALDLLYRSGLVISIGVGKRF